MTTMEAGYSLDGQMENWHKSWLLATPSLLFNISFVMVVVVIIVSNGIVLITLLTSKKLHSLPCFSILASFAVSDFITGWTMALYWISLLTGTVSNLFTCQIIISMSSASIVSSFNHCIVVAADRLYAVLFPFAYKRSRKTALSAAILSAIWLGSLFMTVSLMMSYSVTDFNGLTICTIRTLLGENFQIVSVFAIAYFMTAYISICVSYTYIYSKLNNQTLLNGHRASNKGTLRTKQMPVTNTDGNMNEFLLYLQRSRKAKLVEDKQCEQNQEENEEVLTAMIKLKRHLNSSSRQRRASVTSFTKRKKIHKTLLIITGFLLLCYLPTMICYFLRALGHQSSILNASESWAHGAIVINSAINPFMYATQLPGFKHAFLRLVFHREGSASW